LSSEGDVLRVNLRALLLVGAEEVLVVGGVNVVEHFSLINKAQFKFK